jgi:hypothetical protein
MMERRSVTARDEPICVPNITPAGRRRRAYTAAFFAAIAGLGAVALAKLGLPPLAYLLLGLPLTLSSISGFQAREKT